MAIISLRAVRDVGGTSISQHTISDANITRIVQAHQAMFGPGVTVQAVFDYYLNTLIKRMIASTKSHERSVIPVDDIPVT